MFTHGIRIGSSRSRRGTKHVVNPYAGSQKERGGNLVVDVRVFCPLRGEAVVRSSAEGCVIGYTRQSSIGRRGAFLQCRSPNPLPCRLPRLTKHTMWPPMRNSARSSSSILIQRSVHNPRRPRHTNGFPTVESYLPVWRDCQTTQSGRKIRSAHLTAPPAVPGHQSRQPHADAAAARPSAVSRRGRRPMDRYGRTREPVVVPQQRLGRHATTYMHLLVSRLPVLVGASEIRGRACSCSQR